jgi:hypothetical protein
VDLPTVVSPVTIFVRNVYLEEFLKSVFCISSMFDAIIALNTRSEVRIPFAKKLHVDGKIGLQKQVYSFCSHHKYPAENVGRLCSGLVEEKKAVMVAVG